MSSGTGHRAERLRFAVLLALAALISLPAATLAAGPSATFNGSSGSVNFSRRGTSATVQIPDQPAGDVTVRLIVRTNTVGAGQVASVMIRRAGSASDYRARIQFDAGGALSLSINGIVGGRRVLLAGPQAASGVSWRPNRDLALSVKVSGSSPTRVALKVWAYGASEPVQPQLVALDNAPGAAAGGGRAALRFALPQDATRVPVRFDFAHVTLAATGTTDPPPTPDPTGTPTPAPDPTSTPPTPTPTPTDAPSPTPTRPRRPTLLHLPQPIHRRPRLCPT